VFLVVLNFGSLVGDCVSMGNFLSFASIPRRDPCCSSSNIRSLVASNNNDLLKARDIYEDVWSLVVTHLTWKQLIKFSQVSQQMQKICSSDLLWEHFFKMQCPDAAEDLASRSCKKVFLKHARALERSLDFIPLHRDGVYVTNKGLTLTAHAGVHPFRTAITNCSFETMGNVYVEWIIEHTDSFSNILFGVVTDQFRRSQPNNQIHKSKDAWMYYCCTSALLHAGHRQKLNRTSPRPGRGDRVGILLGAGWLHVYINGSQLTKCAVVQDGFPARVCFAVAILNPNEQVRRVSFAEWPGDVQRSKAC
jgi:hypothetical protein